MYIGIGPEKDTVVKEEQAFDYALERSLHGSPEDQRNSARCWWSGSIPATG